MDRLAQLGANGQNTSGLLVIGVLGDRDPRREQEPVERHWLNTVFLRPVAGQVRPEIFGATDKMILRCWRMEDEVEGMDWWTPPHEWQPPADGEMGTRGGSVDNLANAAH